MTVKSLRHYSASQLLAGGIDLRNTAARLRHGGGGATTLRHYADPVSEVDRRAAAYLPRLTSPVAAPAADDAPKAIRAARATAQKRVRAPAGHGTTPVVITPPRLTTTHGSSPVSAFRITVIRDTPSAFAICATVSIGWGSSLRVDLSADGVATTANPTSSTVQSLFKTWSRSCFPLDINGCPFGIVRGVCGLESSNSAPNYRAHRQPKPLVDPRSLIFLSQCGQVQMEHGEHGGVNFLGPHPAC